MTGTQCPTGVPTCTLNDGAPCCIDISSVTIPMITARVNSFTLSSCNNLATYRG